LRQPLFAVHDAIELALALDWCWDRVEGTAARDFIRAALNEAIPLTERESPLMHRRFRQGLFGLALAGAVGAEDFDSASWREARQRIVTSARTYFKTTFPTYLQWRGAIPTGSRVAAYEEADTALAVELGSAALGASLWESFGTTLAAYPEHYIVSTTRHPTTAHLVLRDDGDGGPLHTVPAWEDLLPLTAHVIAARTESPAAATVADRVEAVSSATSDPLAANWAWAPMVFDLRKAKRVDELKLPSARNLGGAVVFRSLDPTRECVIWVEAGQPLLRLRQHHDAGHFMIHANGHLLISGGDDVAYEATGAKDGQQRLGNDLAPFDFEQFSVATIAHNCLIVQDPAYLPRWLGRIYRPVGGQRLVESTCTSFVGEVSDTDRYTGGVVAYGVHGPSAYARLDLTKAYRKRAVSSYTREFLFLWGRALLVVDRINVAGVTRKPIAVFNVPGRPSVDGSDLPMDKRIAGVSNDAGIWRLDDARQLRWTETDGALYCLPLLPTARLIDIVGGPAKRIPIKSGRNKGKLYVGGSADSFERLVTPASGRRPENAWYRLGDPTLLGPQFGVAPVWGRVEIVPTSSAGRDVFATLFVIGEKSESPEIETSLTAGDDAYQIRIAAGDHHATVLLPRSDPGGEVREGIPESTWKLPEKIEPDPPLPTRAKDAETEP
jgi:hypothetical protein